MRPVLLVFLVSAAVFVPSWRALASLSFASPVPEPGTRPPAGAIPQSTQSREVAPKLPSQSAAAPAGAKKSHIFRGTVEKVDARARTVTVNGENVPGWMAKMTMTYRVDKSPIGTLKAGDRISARVFDGDFSTLYEVRQEQSQAKSADGLPPVSYVCPTAGEETVFEEKPGQCPHSGVPLTPIRLVTAYSCLKYEAFVRDKPGICPVDRNELVPITAALYFTCKNDSKVRQLEPGTCTDGTPRIRTYERRPHGDHNPRHGGEFFMDEDNWHHLEGTFSRPGIFRVYFYDDFTRPLVATSFSVTVTKTDTNWNPISPPIALKLAQIKDRNRLEAAMPGTRLPASFALHVKFRADGKEHEFDFRFVDFSKEPVAIPFAPESVTAASQPANQLDVAKANPAATSASVAIAAAAVPQDSYKVADPIAREEALPVSTPELLAELAKRADSVKTLLAEGNLSAVWYPAIGTKDVALALEESHIGDVPEAKRSDMESAVKRLTMVAWKIDSAGDLGNKDQLLPLYRDFAAAVADIQSAYAAQ